MSRKNGTRKKRIKAKLQATREKAPLSDDGSPSVELVPLPDEPLPVQYPPNEQSERYYNILRRIYHMADDAAYAGAYLELELAQNRAAEMATSEEGSEIPQDFDYVDFQKMSAKLLQLKLIREFIEAFELGAIGGEIMSAAVANLFGGNSPSTEPGSRFFGSEEGFLLHNLKQQLLNRSKR